MDNNEYVDNFMKNLRAATAAMDNSQSPEKRRKKIENTIAKWWRTESIGYKGFKKGGKSDIEYFAHNHARAGIGKEEGWEATKKAMDGHCVFTDDLKSKYDAEYDRTPFDQDFRDGFDKH